MNSKQIFTIPNILSLLRLALIPFIVWSYSIKKFIASAILIVISGITDVVDGFIARKFNMVSDLGKALDPIADKLTILFILFAITLKTPVITPLLVIFILKEIIMGIEGIIIIKKTGTTYSAKWFGKISTVLLYLTILTFILVPNLPLNLSIFLIVINEIVVIGSLIGYTINNIKTTKKILE